MRRRIRRKPNQGLEMRRTRRNPIRESIPSDVIGEILARLPVKDLLRFRCVSKFFKSLIDGPDFIKLHLSHSEKTNTNLYGIPKLFQFKHLALLDLSNSMNTVAVERVNRPLGFQPSREWDVVGSCNGLVALHSTSCRSSDFNIIFWNPLSGKFKKLASSTPNKTHISYGFGYDSKTDDYKLMKIAACYGSGSDLKSGVSIYSLKTDSWKEICKGWLIWRQEDGVFANNTLHWLTKYEGMKIVAFDLVKEEFHLMPVLEFLKGYLYMELSVFDGCLALSGNDRNGAYVWVMKEYGVKESWTNIMSFRKSSDSGNWLQGSLGVTPLAYSRDGAKLLLNHRGHSCHLFWYDLSTKEVEPCLNENEVSRRDVITFVGSLVALNESTDEVELNGKPSSSDMTRRRRRTRGDTSKGVTK